MEAFNETESVAFLGLLFPGGFKDPELIAELCPEGWQDSALSACFHPPPERQYEEYLAMRRNFERLRKLPGKSRSEFPEPEVEPELNLAEFLREISGQQRQPVGGSLIDEPAELLGLCLWDVFSDNHEVIAADGRTVDLGSFRGSAGTIADFFEYGTAPASENSWWGGDYMRFYMGTSMISGRTDLTPAYRLIFSRLKRLGATWSYSFPRIHVIDFGPPEEETAVYDPSAAVARDMARKRRADELHRTRKRLDRDALAAMREARAGQPPATVRAYQEIYGRFPQGWPPDPYAPI